MALPPLRRRRWIKLGSIVFVVFVTDDGVIAALVLVPFYNRTGTAV